MSGNAHIPALAAGRGGRPDPFSRELSPPLFLLFLFLFLSCQTRGRGASGFPIGRGGGLRRRIWGRKVLSRRRRRRRFPCPVCLRCCLARGTQACAGCWSSTIYMDGLTRRARRNRLKLLRVFPGLAGVRSCSGRRRTP